MRLSLAPLAGLLAISLPWAGCSQQATTVPVRSLERSGQAAFVCLGSRSTAPGQEMDGCFAPATPPAANDYAVPHAIALVTQTARGELAVIDLTSQTVLDTNPAVPGYNFLPIGSLPTDVVATPGGNASFVSIGDPLRPGIFAIPSSRLPFQPLARPSTLASWPACSLDIVPTAMVVVPDRAHKHVGLCDATPEPVPDEGYDLASEVLVYGRTKIVVLLPDAEAPEGHLAVIDAQELLARQPGSFDPCRVEQTIRLGGLPAPSPEVDAGTSDVASDAPAEASASDGSVAEASSGAGDAATDADGAPPVDPSTCGTRVAPSPPSGEGPHPVAMALSDDGRLFISDDRAAVIHVLDASDPCALAEQAPLLPFSAADPTRTVVTTSLAVSPLTSDHKRFVYAVDARGGGNVMVFNVSAGSTERRPLLRTDGKYNLFDAPDRVTFSSPVEGLTFATHEVPLGIAVADGTVPRGVKCDPLVTAPDDPAFPYIPVNFAQGAGPRRLRGTFGFAALTNGRVAVIDLDDYDEVCRRPAVSDDKALGCTGKLTPFTAMNPLPSASGEVSCRVVERHLPRAGQYFANAVNAGRHAPSMQAFPLLYDGKGTVLSTDPMRDESAKRPKLLGPSLQAQAKDAWPLLASVIGIDSIPDGTDNALASDPRKATRNWVSFDLFEPRVHRDETWSVTYEGIIPTLNGRRGRFVCAADKKPADCEGGDKPSNFVLFDSSVGFCDQGVQGRALAKAVGLPGEGDIVVVTEPLPDPADLYWSTVGDACSVSACTMLYGTPDDPKNGRDLGVEASFENRLVLSPNADRGNSGASLGCCFPYPPTYVVRAGKHWLVKGSSTGYQHHILPDPTAADSTGASCVVSCNDFAALRNSRVAGRAPPLKDTDIPLYDDPSVFHNAQIRFVLWSPATCTGDCLERDMSFSFVESGGFGSIEVGLSAIPVLTQGISFVRGIDQLAIPDAVSQGLMLFDLDLLSVNGVKAFY